MTIDNATNAAAGAAVSSPWWLPGLQEMSETAALFLPIFGVVWLAVQIASKVIEHKSRRP